MNYILNIESSTTNCSISLALDGNLVALKESNDDKYSHSTKLHSFINEVLKKSNISVKELVAIAVSKGPGSYTGLRIGVAAAKGLCYSLDIPLISISTLHILSKQIQVREQGLILPVMDARRDEVYCAVYDSSYNLIKKAVPKIINQESFSELSYKSKLYFIGNGQEKCKRLIENNTNLIFSNNNTFPSAREMTQLSYQKFKDLNFNDIAYFEPDYLKDFMPG
ncbi:tRNA (adenosine(37)-N6)-threonylcarbamoyltransferase complex dimerization subunit type 1 TsaB [Flavobacteriaceae bacterium]|nr:tRNA (adenosine(37)-N6)-threonylcarbamoyltransferase complex dimerization subunit type 1 TsaB [Flavobacteriaceae bacterium]|tara:strand:+ start:8971 stop:9639 length:669 start_codon:yes stop_codon:yes gene_type:complete